MSTSAENRGQFGSKLGFILSAAGSAVGLGNIWKFPGKAYFCGGGAFLIIYLIIVALVGTTVMMAEFTVGRKTHKNAVGAMRELNAKWSWVGGLGVLTGFIILCYYCQVGGWAMKYIVAYIVDVKTIWADPTAYFLNNLLGADGTFPLQGAVIFPFIFLFLTAYIISHGTAGIEKMSKLLMPLLFIMLIALMIRSCTLPGADDGLKYMLNVDFSTINGVAILTALGQAFFSLSVAGNGTLIYGSYLSDKEDIPASAARVGLFDTLAALLAALVIIPAMATTGSQLDQGGPGLMFIFLPNLFHSMPGGSLFAIIFFVAVLFAGMTSLLNLYETPIATLQEKFNFARVPACLTIGIIGIVVSICIQGIVSGWMDVLSIYICPLGAGLAAIMFFWFCKREFVEAEVNKGRDKPLFPWFYPLCKYVLCPVCVLVLILGALNGGIG